MVRPYEVVGEKDLMIGAQASTRQRNLKENLVLDKASVRGRSLRSTSSGKVIHP